MQKQSKVKENASDYCLANLEDRLTLKPSDTNRGLYFHNDNILQLKIEEGIITTSRLPHTVTQSKLIRHSPNRKNSDQRCIKSTPRYEISVGLKKNWEKTGTLLK